MTSLIGAGLGARRRAQQGFGAVAQLEQKELRQMDLLDAAREQQEMSNLGTGAGFGAMYGLSQLPAAASTVAPTAASASTLSAAAGAEAAALKAGADAAAAGQASSAVMAPGAGGASAGSALATLAMPIAIGLGAAFLINKLFD